MTDPLRFEDAPPTAEEEQRHLERDYQRPVAWLFGRQFVRSLKFTLVYTAFGKKLDPRDWMNPRAYTFAAGAPTNDASTSAAGEGAGALCPPPWSPRADDAAASSGEDFWFDYLSDTGDGMKAVYSLAYLCMSDLWVKDSGDPPQLPAPEDARVEKEQQGAGYVHLPRGSFLMVGGDTAYHMSDYATLADRFQLPFRWAFRDLSKNLGARFDTARRPIFGIPGNHDYYDQLDGFRRQFRRTIRPEPLDEPNEKAPVDYRNPQLMLAGFVRCQEASYVALELPHGWWLWGLDTEVGTVDERQRKFFRKLASRVVGGSEADSPSKLKKLIVATCAPTTVFGKFADRDDEKSSRAFYQLGLPRPFLHDTELEKLPDEKTDEPRLQDDQCRLDISGDIHQYARYWGPANTGDVRVREHSKVEPTPERLNYASVVSGIGGAFHHPTQTYKGELHERALYPPVPVSRKEVSKQIFRFWNLLNGGMVWLVGGILAFTIYCGLMVSQSSSEFVHSFAFWERAGLFSQKAVSPTVPVVDQQTEVTQFWSGATWPVPAPPADKLCADARKSVPDCAKGCDAPRYFLGACAVAETPGEYKVGVWLTLISLALVVAGFLLSDWLFDDPDERRIEKLKGLPPETKEEAEQRKQQTGEPPATRAWYAEQPFQRVALVALPTMLAAALAVLTLMPYRAHLTPFGNSMLVLVTIIWAVAAVALNVRYTEWLFTKSSMKNLKSGDWALTWLLGVFAVVSLGAGLWVFGKNNRAAFLVADIIFALVVLGAAVGLAGLGYAKAGELQDKWYQKLPYLGLGIFHALLQIATPFLLVRKGTWLTLLVLPLVVAVFGFLGWLTMKDDRRWLLALLWLLHGAAVLLLPWLTWRAAGGAGAFLDQPGLLSGYTGWWGLVPSALAGVLGALLCCVWLGWYFAVSLAFHGHNNEAAGAARIERFKQFVRVRVNAEGLTAYVIAVDYPKRDGGDLKPRLVDVFHLRAQP